MTLSTPNTNPLSKAFYRFKKQDKYLERLTVQMHEHFRKYHNYTLIERRQRTTEEIQADE